ncbi:MAG: hypothetical protein ACE5K9_09275, partial [Candidatus Methylomirabilales bacterium]
MKHLSKIALTKRDYFFLEITAPRCLRCGILSLNSICTYCQNDIDDGLEWPWLGKPGRSKKIVVPLDERSQDGSPRKIGLNSRREVRRRGRQFAYAASGNGSSRGIGRRHRAKKRPSRRGG